MPSWKKLITSGSSAVLSNITLSNLQTQGSELTSVMVNTGGVVGTRELSSTAFSTMDNYGSFTAAGDVGVDQTISSGNTLTFTGTNGITTTGVAGDSVDIALNATQTGITSVLNTGLIVGRDAHNQIDFATTDNEIHFKTNNETPVIKMKAAGEIEATSLDISGGVDIAGAITSAEWTGDVIASAYLDADTAHLTTTQTFSGAKTFSSLASFTMDGNTITGVDDSGEFTDDDAHIMTSAAVQDKILGYGYTTEVGDITGVTAGTGMSGGGTSGTVTLTNAGVTSNVAGTGISVSGATGAVTITNAGVTSNVAGDLIDVSGATGAVTVNVDLSELTDGTADVVGSADELVYLDDGTQKRKQINEIKLGQFNNDQSWSATVGTVTSVTAGTGMTQSGTSTVNPTLNVIGGTCITANADDIAVTADSIGDTQLAYNTGQHLTTSSDVNFNTINVNATTTSTNKTSGALIVDGGLGVNENIHAGGDVVAYASSDKRLKDNLQVIQDPLDKVGQISGYEFDWNEESPEWAQERGHDIGVVAQEIQKVLPEIVTERTNGYLGVDYKRIIPLLIESIKELKQEVEDLKKKVN